MITRQFIAQLATKYQTIEQNVAREYCQHLFLSYFYKKAGSEKIVFKGGTALRIIFNSPRFSEDLDFSAADGGITTYPQINRLVDETLDDIRKEGTQCEKEIKSGTQGETSGGYFAVIKLKMLEFDSEIQLQISFRNPDKVVVNTTLVQSDFTAPYVVIYLVEDILVAEKIQALLKRKNPRDFFDLYFILRNPRLIKYIPRKAGLKDEVLNTLAQTSNLEKELKIFLPVSLQNTVLKDFAERLKREIEAYLS